MMDEVRIEWHGVVACLIIDRPAVRNAIALETMAQMESRVAELAASESLRAVVLAGGGGRFIAGGDLGALESVRTEAGAVAMATQMQRVLDAIEALPVPVIAAVDRFALGGGAEVALAADLRVASVDAQIAFKHAEFGVSSAWGAARRLSRLIGHGRAMALLWGGATVQASEAQMMGLVNRVAPRGKTALDVALAWAAQLAAREPLPMAATKQLLVSAGDLPRAEHRALEAQLFAQTWVSDAHWARVDAWKKRPRRPKPARRGRFIVLEGLDGAGTTTQAKMLAQWLESEGRTAVLTAEPSEGPVGKQLRAALTGQLTGRDGARLTPRAVALMFAADRADHLATEIEPALAAGSDVICDRYVMSSLAYQGAEGHVGWVAGLNAPMRSPDLTLMIRVSPRVAAERRAKRGGAEELYDADAFQRRVADGYRDAPQWRAADLLVVIDGDDSVEAVQSACRVALEEHCPIR